MKRFHFRRAVLFIREPCIKDYKKNDSFFFFSPLSSLGRNEIGFLAYRLTYVGRAPPLLCKEEELMREANTHSGNQR